jgi:hypothetical protein
LPPRELSFLCSHRLQTQPHSNSSPVLKLDAKRLEGAHYSGYCVEAASKWLGSALLHGAYRICMNATALRKLALGQPSKHARRPKLISGL